MDNNKKSKILEAIQKMDPENDNHWTVQGEAKLETIKFLSGGMAVTRDELNEIAPGFSREAMAKYLAGQIQEPGNDGQAAAPVAGANGNGPAVQSEPSEVEDGSADREAEVEALASQIRDTHEAILECQRVQGEMTKKISQLQIQGQKLEADLQKIKPAPTHQMSIKAYLDTQKAALVARGEARKTVVNSGLDLAALSEALQPSALDLSLRNRPRQVR